MNGTNIKKVLLFGLLGCLGCIAGWLLGELFLLACLPSSREAGTTLASKPELPALKGGSTIGIPSPPAIWVSDNPLDRTFITPAVADAEQLQGFPRGWTDVVDRMPRGHGHRWKLVGNAVSVPMATWVGKRLAKPGVFDDARLAETVRAGVSWPRAACGGPGREPRQVAVSMWPVRNRRTHLSKFLEHATKPLSLRAAAGFLERANDGSLRFEDGFLEAVGRHVDVMRTKVVA